MKRIDQPCIAAMAGRCIKSTERVIQNNVHGPSQVVQTNNRRISLLFWAENISKPETARCERRLTPDGSSLAFLIAPGLRGQRADVDGEVRRRGGRLNLPPAEACGREIVLSDNLAIGGSYPPGMILTRRQDN